MKTGFCQITVRWCGVLVLATAAGLGTGTILGAEAPKIQTDDTPLKREVKEATSFAGVVKKTSPSVVHIFTTKRIKVQRPDLMPFLNDPSFRRFFGEEFNEQYRRQPQTRQERSLGSGVIVTEDGYILTNNHVVDGADEIKVAMGEGRQQYTAKVVGKDPKADIAVLKIEATGLPAIVIGNSDLVEVGDLVVAIGNPFGLGRTVTVGVVGALGRGIGIEEYEDFIQTDAAINPGNSGGALVDAQGRLVGVNTAILSRTGGNLGIGFAIPSNMAHAIMDSLVTEGKVSRGYLGVSIQDLDPALARQFKLTESGGALVGDIVKGGAAEEAGLKSGDVILQLDGKPVRDSRTLRLTVAAKPPGSRVELKVLRNGEEKTFTAKLKQLPDNLAPGRPSQEGDEVLKEVAVDDLNPQIRRQYQIPDDVEGAVVASVDPDSPAAEAGLRVGDVILEVNRKPIRNAEDAVEATRNVKDKTVLLRVWSQGGIRFLVVDESKP